MTRHSPANANDINGVDLLLILFVTVSWGLNYPIMKFVVTSYPPLTFRACTFTIGFALLGAVAWYQGKSLRVPVGERWLAFQLGVPNMVFWHVGLIYGVTLLNSGRVAIVGYTMPVWALLASVVMFGTNLLLGVYWVSFALYLPLFYWHVMRCRPLLANQWGCCARFSPPLLGVLATRC